MEKTVQLTTAAGTPVADNQNSQTAGPRGPVLMQDYQLMEKMAHFNRERVPERVVHAKGAGAHGRFTVTADLGRYTRAKLFARAGNSCPVFSRFSTVAGESGTADTARDPRGFSLKFYTEEGNWDMVGGQQHAGFLRPRPAEILRFHPLPEARPGHRTARQHDAVGFLEPVAGIDLDHHRRDLHEAIARGEFPQWKVQIQIMPEADAETCRIHPFDLTKVWPHRDYPLVDVGVLELNCNPQNYFAEVEQAAFEPGNMPPGMSASPDKMLQARLLSYPDAHRYRIGINYAALPINRPHCVVHTYHRDGATRFDGNGAGAVNYAPNSFGGPVDDPRLQEPPLKLHGDAGIFAHREGNEDCQQAGDLYRLMSVDQRAQLVGNLIAALQPVPRFIQVRQIGHFRKADPDYGDRVAGGLGIGSDELDGKAA